MIVIASFQIVRHAWRWGAALLAIVTGLHAQTLEGVAVFKIDEYTQDASGSNPVAYDIGAEVFFANTVNSSAQVLLVNNQTGAILNLTLASDGYYTGDAQYPSRAAVDAAFPDGSYKVTVSSGSSTIISVVAGLPVAPVSITNLAALQNWQGDFPTVQWTPLPTYGPNDLFILSFYDAAGDDLGSASLDLSASSYTVGSTISAFPFEQTLTADLTYTQLSETYTGQVEVLAGHGFNVEFSVFCAVPPPVITLQPSGTAVASGSMVTLVVDADLPYPYNGLSTLSYQWSKNGVPIPGATSSSYTLPVAQGSDGGSYTVTITDSGGSVTSQPATVAVGAGLSVSTYAGVAPKSGYANPGYLDGPATTALFNHPAGLALDAAGNLYVADSGNHVIRKISPQGMVSTYAGQANAAGTTDGTVTSAQFETPWGLALDRSGNLYVSDQMASTIRLISASGEVTTIAGTAGSTGSTDGAGTAAKFNQPMGLALDGSGNLYVADNLNYAVRKIAPDHTVSTYAGQPGNPFAFQNGPVATAVLGSPTCLAIAANGNLYVGFNSESEVAVITPAGIVSAAAGQPGPPRGYYNDGIGANVSFDALFSMALAGDGSLYLGDVDLIRRLTSDGVVTTLTGTNPYGYADGVGAQAALQYIPGLVIDAAGTVYAADCYNDIIRKAVWSPGSTNLAITATLPAQLQTVATGSSIALSASTSGQANWYAWLHNGTVVPNAATPTLLVSGADSAAAGTYTFVVGNSAGTVSTSPLTLNVVSTSDPGRIINLSVLAEAGPGSQILTTGFVLGGSTGGTRSLLVRGVGPQLSQYGVAQPLAAPTLKEYSGTTNIASDAGWGSDPALVNAAIVAGAFPLPPNSLDSALLQSLAAGPYTVQVSSANSGTGMALAELYDLAPASASSGPVLINISCLAQVDATSPTLTAGFVIGGSTSRAVLIRGVGPGLATFGVAGSLAAPQLQVYSSGSMVAGNTGWNGDITVAQIAKNVDAFSLNSNADCALATTLPPGVYTAAVSGQNGSTGAALVEVYVLP
jgi:hypothetical protein